MTALRSRPVNGFTLVELLVVAGLMAGMLGLVLATSRPDPGVQLRRFSQSVSSSILATQTRALGNESGAALVITAPSGTSVAASERAGASVAPAAACHSIWHVAARGACGVRDPGDWLGERCCNAPGGGLPTFASECPGPVGGCGTGRTC